MTRSEIKNAAKENLKGRWGDTILIVVIYALILGGLNYIMNHTLSGLSLIVEIAYLLISVPMAYIFIMMFMKFRREEETNVGDLITKIPETFKPSWKCTGAVLYKMLPYVIAYVVLVFLIIFSSTLLVAGTIFTSTSVISSSTITLVIALIILLVISIPASMRSYYYTFTQYIMIDSENTLKAMEAAEKSREIMEGHRWEYFVFQLSFFGWAILAVLSFGIGMLWLMPYMQVATVIFYESLTGKKKEATIEPATDPINTEE